MKKRTASYPYAVILKRAYCGSKCWGCQTMHHAQSLAAEFRAKGIAVTRVI